MGRLHVHLKTHLIMHVGLLGAIACGNIVGALFASVRCCELSQQVCTGQYFIWYMGMLPLLAPSLGLFSRRPPQQVSNTLQHC